MSDNGKPAATGNPMHEDPNDIDPLWDELTEFRFSRYEARSSSC
jgi:hypothetical protein